jgi:hypothetical protein
MAEGNRNQDLILKILEQILKGMVTGKTTDEIIGHHFCSPSLAIICFLPSPAREVVIYSRNEIISSLSKDTNRR